MPDQTAERPQLKPFGQFVQEQRNGGLHDELSVALAELVAQCVETGKKGTLTLKVSVVPTKDEVTVLVTDDVAVKAPKHDAKPALFFPDENGNLLRRDPRQPELPLREIRGAKGTETDDEKEASGQ
jgi:hypothetical protein